MIFAGVLIIYDFIWFSSTSQNRTNTYAGTDIWNNLHDIRIFAFFLSLVSTLLKVKAYCDILL